ncbi:FkbM family methyltransferase [Bosea caraganae]|uniref:FkbM family methyltransferase n=1 Tax=Bosea caraganae TaxID=2763117 RepID=UPI0015F091F1|nr:FkbM family methyltransferase [Bosea caraganae]
MQTYLSEGKWGKFLLLRGDLISQYVSMYGEWAETEVDLFKTLLPRDGICIEVGTNMGTLAVPISRICEEGAVYCFEPQRPIFHILCANIALNNRLNVFARNEAVGETDELISIETGSYDATWNYGAFSLGRGFSNELSFTGPVQRETVRMVQLDRDLQIAALSRIDLLKIDVEGFEPAVLRGARELITRHRPYIFVEANTRAGFDDCMLELGGHGYTGHWYIAGRYRQDNFARSPFGIAGWDTNLIFHHASRPPLQGNLPKASSFDDLATGLTVLTQFP